MIIYLKYAAICIISFIIPTFAYSLQNIANDEDINNLNWSLDDNGTLTVVGKGEMNFHVIPWLHKKQYIHKINIGEGVTTIQSEAFSNCYNVEDINLPTSLKKIGVNSFYCGSHKIKEVIIPDSVESIGNGAFCALYQLEKLKIGKSVQRIGYQAFYGACHNLKHIIIPASVQRIDVEAFAECTSLKTVEFLHDLSDSISIGSGAFSHCDSLTKVILPKKLHKINSSTFSYCSIDSINLPKSLKSIEPWAFAGCKLKTLSLPSSIEYIGPEAFEGCTYIQDVYVYWDIPIDIYDILFKDVNKEKSTLYIPQGTYEKYYASNWRFHFKRILEMQTTQINNVPRTREEVQNSVYSINGIQIHKPHNGLYIIKYNNGKTKKVMIK